MKYVHSIAVLALIFAVVLGLPACKPPSGGQSGHEIEEFSENVELTKGQQEFLLKAARTALAGQPMPAFTADLENTIAGGVTVEVFLPPNRPVLAAVAKQPFSKAFAEAVELARTDSGFDRMKSKLDDARIKIGLMRRIRELKYRDDEKGERAFRDIAKQTEDAMDGFILAHNNGQVFYQLGEEVLYRGWGMGRRGERDRYMGRKLVKRQMRDLGREGEKNTNGWRNGKLYSFRTFTFVDDVARRGRPVESFRAKNLLPPLTKESLRAAAVANADYLARAVRDDGKFHYVYFPALNVYETRAYSIVRHAGSVYGLFEAYNHFGDEKYLTAGRKALDYLVDNIVIPEEASEIAIVKEGRRSNLGVNALTAMAYAVIPGDHMTEKEGEYRDKLGESILYYRMPEKGLFYTYFQQALQKNPPKEQARYYPGEAMLALVRLFERTGDKKWWDAAVDLAPGQKELWLNAGHNEVGNYCWVGQAFARMARLEKDPEVAKEYKEVAYSHAEAVIKHQFDEKRAGWRIDYVGGADNSRPPRTTPTSARGESLAENYLTAKFFGETENQKKYGVAALKAIHFFVENQWSPQNSWFLPYPDKADGGIRGSLIANDIRIDYNQHALSTEINALSIPEDLAALGVSGW